MWENSWAALGCERIGPRHGSWRTENVTGTRHLVVFPRVPFELCTARGRVIADSNRVIFANPGSVYRRVALSAWGERSDWIGIERAELVEMLASAEPSAAERQKLFARIDGPAEAKVYLEQRRLFSALLRGSVLDSLQVEELVLELVRAVIHASVRPATRRMRCIRSETRRAHRELVDEAQRMIARRFAERLTLRTLAEPLGVTPSHLARIFRDETGSSLHAYLVQARLRAALAYLPDASGDLIRVAHAVGFSSHSHFSAAFRRAFGVTPSGLRWPVPGAARRARF